MNTRSPIPPLLAVDNLGKSFGGVRAVDGIGFTLAWSSGPSGTTLGGRRSGR